jgi:hypothetical protein
VREARIGGVLEQDLRQHIADLASPHVDVVKVGPDCREFVQILANEQTAQIDERRSGIGSRVVELRRLQRGALPSGGLGHANLR